MLRFLRGYGYTSMRFRVLAAVIAVAMFLIAAPIVMPVLHWLWY